MKRLTHRITVWLQVNKCRTDEYWKFCCHLFNAKKALIRASLGTSPTIPFNAMPIVSIVVTSKLPFTFSGKAKHKWQQGCRYGMAGSIDGSVREIEPRNFMRFFILVLVYHE